MARLQKKRSPQDKTRKRVRTTGDGATKTVDTARTQTAAAQAGAEKPLVKKVSPKGNKPVASAKAIATGREPNWIQKSVQFLREVKVELKKVTWPSRKQTIGSTVVVLVLVILASLFLGLVDMGLTNFVRLILQ